MIHSRPLLVLIVPLSLAGCAQPNSTDLGPIPSAPVYSRPLAPGESALRLTSSAAYMPALHEAYANRDAFLLDA